MGRYNKFEQQAKPKQERNPIWRGIGCILMILVPAFTYLLTVVLIDPVLKTGLVPPEIMKHIRFPDWVYKTVILKDMATFLSGIDNLWLGVILFILILILLTGISSLIFVWVSQAAGPPRYGPTDAPPSKQKTKRYTR
jgi:hypothetical protein